MVYEALNEGALSAGKTAAEYGRWLIQSILLLHSGAIAGLATYMANVPAQRPQIAWAMVWFIAGIVAIIAAGL